MSASHYRLSQMRTAELIRDDCLVRLTSQSEINSQIHPQLSHVFVSVVLMDQILHVKSKTSFNTPFLRFKNVLQPFLPATLLVLREIFLDHRLQKPITNIVLSCILTQLVKYQHAFRHVAS